MKKLILIAIVAWGTFGCASYRQITYIGDFRKYTDENFVVSVVATGYEYDPVGEVVMKFSAGRKPGYIRPGYNPTSRRASLPKNFFVPTYEFMLDELVKEAKSLGATGLLNLRINEVKKSKSSTYYTASGFAVKIKK